MAQDSQPPPPAPPPSRRFTDPHASEVATVIGAAIQIKGELSGDDPVLVAGTIEGPSIVTGLYRVEKGARVLGDVQAASIVVNGEVSGTTLAADKVEIGASARVQASVRARVVALAEGAFFDGQIHMEGGDPEGAAVSFKEKRKARPGL
jgi:cytoskeletal protein CcmA (bactofilin family)